MITYQKKLIIAMTLWRYMTEYLWKYFVSHLDLEPFRPIAVNV